MTAGSDLNHGSILFIYLKNAPTLFNIYYDNPLQPGSINVLNIVTKLVG